MKTAPRLGLYCSIVSFLAAGMLLLSVFILLPISYFTGVELIETFTLMLLFGGTFFSILYHCIAPFVKCPACKEKLMFLWFKRAHKDSSYDNGMEVAFHWFTGKVSCVSCGTEITTNGT